MRFSLSLVNLLESVINSLYHRNSEKYNIKKACEELSELNTVLMQTLNKWNSSDKRPAKQEVIDEIGDVIIRVSLLRKQFGPDLVDNRIYRKLAKYKDYISNNSYKEI